MELDRLAASLVSARVAPAAVCAVGLRAANGWELGVGAAGTHWPKSDAPVRPDTVFDLASLTKPVIAVAVATESARGTLRWDMPLGDLLPELRGTWGGQRTVEHHLSHRSGLLAHVELFRFIRSGRTRPLCELYREAANAVDVNNSIRAASRPVYSDLGYILVGSALESRFAEPLDRWLINQHASLCGDELGSIRSWFARDAALRIRCAPTECVPWRGGIVWCRTHDENAWVLAGHGLCGHAGLFGTAAGVVRFGAMVVDALVGRPSAVPPTAARLVTDERPGGSLCAGFDRKSSMGSSAGTLAGNAAFGHLGFTGTSIWCDPEQSIVVAVLTNRVCPNRGNLRIKVLRPSLHDALFAWGRAQ